MTQNNPEGSPRGRPLKFESVEVLEQRINAYFDDCDTHQDTRLWSHDEIIVEENGKRVCSNCWMGHRTRGCLLVSGRLKLPRPYTVTGLALWLETTRQTLLEYQGEVEGRQRDPRFADTIVLAKLKIENYASEKLFDKDTPTRGVIFSLSNNSKDWAEKKEETLTVKKDSAEALAKRVFDDDDEVEHTVADDDDFAASGPASPEADLDTGEAQAVPENKSDAEALS